jgi:hypothetical protein
MEVIVPLLRRGSLTAPARRNTIAADQGVTSMAKYLLEVVESPKRRREPELVILSPAMILSLALGAS